MRLKTALAAMLAVLALPARTGWSDDWPQWRGSGRDAAWRATGILEEFPPDGLKVCWHSVVGPGWWSSPVVAAGRVYLTEADGKQFYGTEPRAGAGADDAILGPERGLAGSRVREPPDLLYVRNDKELICASLATE
jgi:hypothetical protein